MYRVTKAILDTQVAVLNHLTERCEGERYYVGYENGYANLFCECDGGRATISYGNTKRELSDQMRTLIDVIVRESNRKGGD